LGRELPPEGRTQPFRLWVERCVDGVLLELNEVAPSEVEGLGNVPELRGQRAVEEPRVVGVDSDGHLTAVRPPERKVVVREVRDLVHGDEVRGGAELDAHL